MMVGPPEAGTGTQGEWVASVVAVPRVSTGDVLHEAVAAEVARAIDGGAW